MTPEMRNHVADAIVDRLIRDLSDRMGFDAVWDQCDDEVRESMKQRWREKVAEELRRWVE